MPERSGSRIVIREIQSPSDKAFPAAYRLLHGEFHEAEMSPRRDWTNALRERAHGLLHDVAWHLMVAERGGRVIAAASGTYLGNVNVGVIGYVVVRRNARVAGLGPRIRQALRKAFEADAVRLGHGALEAIVGEVRADNPWLRSLVRREGALALDFEYVQPALDPKLEPVPLVFYYQPLRRPVRSLDAAYLRRLLFTIWRRAYRVSRPLARPAFRRMLRSIAQRRRIGSRPEFRSRSAAGPPGASAQKSRRRRMDS
jgi:hypothetical protein